MGRRFRPTPYVVLICAIIVAIGAGWFISQRPVEKTGNDYSATSDLAAAPEKRQIYLYFGHSQGCYLTAERRVIDQPVDIVDSGRTILQTLLLGPEKGGIQVMPEGVGIRAFYVMEDGVAFVDFASGSFDKHPGGVTNELLSIYSIVNTLVLNVDGIRSVKILIGGQEAATLTGHVDLSHPFKADMLWVR